MAAQQDSKQDKVVIELVELTRVYGRGHTAVTALSRVNLHVEAGEVVLVMGPSGSGKTTLIQLIGALLRPTSGEVVVNGRSLAELPENELAGARLSTFGFIFQRANLLAALTAQQNVELVLNIAGLKGPEAHQRAAGLLERLGLGSRLDHRPAQLSGGEQQRVAIARALANDPAILLADEPTANLDSKTGQAVTALLRDIAKEEGRTVIIVSHDLRLRPIADRVLWLEDGRLSLRWSQEATLDPVCLMVVNGRAAASLEHEGQTYHFCSRECKRKFSADPARYRQVNP